MKKASNVIWGFIIVIAGIVFLGNNFDFWDFDIFFDGWWTLFIIIPSFYGLFKKEWISSILGISIGFLLLLACQDFIEWNMVGRAFLPLVLILIGVSLIFKPKTIKPKVNKKGITEYLGIFSSTENKVNTKFEGASIVAIFGGVVLDLREAKIESDVVIDAVTIFGGIDIFLPDNVIIKASGIPVFGGMENKHKGKKGNTIYLNYTTIFAGVDVK